MLIEGYLSLWVLGSTGTAVLVSGLVLLPLPFVAVRGRLQLPTAIVSSLVIFGLTLAISSVANGSSASLVLAATKVELLPLGALLVGYNSIRILTIVRLLPVAAVLMVVNAGFAIWQSVVGVEGLLAQGYVYSLTVRDFGPTAAVRAFGLLPRDNILGQVAALMLIVSIWALVHIPRSRAWAGVLSAASLTSLVLSHNRTAEILAVVAIVAVSGGRSGVRRWTTRAQALVGVGIATAAVASVTTFGTLDSLTARLSVWSGAVSSVSPLWGGGPGHSGVTASTTLAQSVGTTSVGDNNYVTMIANFGLLGLVACLPVAVWLIRGWISANGPRGALLGGLLSFLFLSMITDNLWEEVPTALILMLFIGAALRSGGGLDSALGDQRAVSEPTNHGSSAIRARSSPGRT